MALGVVLLVLLAAVCHALWNFAARRVSGDFLVIWLGIVLGCAALLPFAIVVAIRSGVRPWMTPAAVGCMLATGIIHVAYFILLGRAYREGEISVVYPVARGSGIGLTMLLAWLLLRENISALGATGITLISAGILAMGIPAFKSVHGARGFKHALCVGTSIVAYSLVDKVGVSKVNPVPYICIMYLIMSALLWPLVLRGRGGEVRKAVRTNLRYILVIGIGSIGTYLMILFAFALGPVSYVVAMREFSVVAGTFLGVLVLKERLTLVKTLAIAAITLGMICIKAG